jgi:trehalose 6-phosphate phosphatase
MTSLLHRQITGKIDDDSLSTKAITPCSATAPQARGRMTNGAEPATGSAGLPRPDRRLLEGASLFLDFDGTLAEFESAPDQVTADEELRALLARLHERLDGRLALLSGRPVADLNRILRMEGLAIGGSHGLERLLPDGRHIMPDPPPGLDEMIGEADRYARKKGLVVEPKPWGVALHFRATPEAKDHAEIFMRELSRRHGMAVQHGSMVTELRLAGPDKGHALESLMKEPPFRSGRPVMVGDDLTDEHAFAAANRLGGISVLVGAPRATAAHYRLPSVAAVRDWLSP